jgi:hypothetical protein
VSVCVNGGLVCVKSPSLRADRELLWRSRWPGWYGGRDAVDRFLARCVAPGSLSIEIPDLSERDRRRLMLAVVRARGMESFWRRLYGSQLGSDERFFLVMAWGSERESERLKAALSQLRRTIAGRSRAGLDAALADKGVPGSFGAFGIGKVDCPRFGRHLSALVFHPLI